MLLKLLSDKPPLAADADGVVRVRGSRVTLDTIVLAFGEGATAEEIVQQYPSLALGDVYSVLDYYLQRKAEVDEYVRGREEKANRVRKENEARFSSEGVRERLLARRYQSRTDQATPF